MTTRSLTLVHAAMMTLLVTIVPAAALAQEQKQPEAPQQETPSAGQAQQKQAETSAPAQMDQDKTTVQPEQQQGQVVVPSAGKTAAAPQEAKIAPPAEEGGTYTIKQGDTLWDISNTFLKDPFLWPFLWKANPSITNPDLIYPGNKLVIPSMAPIERAMKPEAQAEPQEKVQPEQKEPAAQAPEETAAVAPPAPKAPVEAAPQEVKEEEKVSKLIVPEEAPVPIIDKYAMLNAGFVNQEESRDLIVGSKEGKTIFGYDDLVYAKIRSKENAAVGDKFLIYLPLDKVRHPITGRKYGRLVKVLGILQLTEKGAPDTFMARITLSFDAAQIGSMLTPYQEPTLIYKSTTPPKAKDITGCILEVTDSRTINAQIDIVYLDKGSADGVEAGDRFVVYTVPRKKAYPKPLIGEVQVFLVKEHTATAIVRKSTETLERGDRIEYKK